MTNKSYYELNKERISKQAKARYQLHKETRKAQSRARYELNKEQLILDAKEWKRKNPEKFKASQDKWIANNPTYVMTHNAKRRARELNLPFDLDWRDIRIPTHCPIFGIELWQDGYRDSAPSLDRIDPAKGYVSDNVKIISLKANRIKAEGSAEDHEKIAHYIRNPDLY